MKTRNPLRLDPSQTTSIRRSLFADMQRRFGAIQLEIWNLIVKEDSFGLLPAENLFFNARRWQFETDDRKLKSFQRWLQQQIDNKLLVVDANGDPWLSKDVRRAYMKGVDRAYAKVRKGFLSAGTDAEQAFVTGVKSEFMRFMNSTKIYNKLRLLYTRSFEQLKGVTSAMSQQLARVLTEGLVNRSSPREIARQMISSVSTLTENRAKAIVRTELVYVQAEGQLDTFEELEVDEVTIEAEWTTSGNPCPQCAPMEGVILSIEDARGLIPRHTNCLCSWEVAVSEDRSTKKRIAAAVKKSARAEHPKSKSPIKSSKWSGIDLL